MLEKFNALSDKKQIGLVCLIAFIVYLSGNVIVPVTDPVECNYVEGAKEMLAKGDWVVPWIHGHAWFDKPIFIFWELLTAFSIFGINDFACRFFPSVFAVLSLAMTWYAGRKLFDQKTAILATLLLASSFGFWYMAKAVITDMSLFLFHNGEVLAFYLGYTSKNRKLYYICWILAGLAVLTKGPIGILLPGLTIMIYLIYKKDLKEFLHFKFITGGLIFLIIAGSWYAFMYDRCGDEFIGSFLGTHNVLRATVSEHPKNNTWWFYCMIFAASCFPWIFPFIHGCYKHYREQVSKKLNPTTAFLFIWGLTVIGFYECMATKYTTYIFPSMMPISLFAAYIMGRRKYHIYGMACFMAVFYIILATFVAPPIIRYQNSGVEIAPYITENTTKDDLIVSFGKYRCSETFYSDRVIRKLDTKESIEDNRPEAMSWKALNVMPFYAYEDLPDNKVFYVVCESENLDEFKKNKYFENRNFEIIKETHAGTLIKVLPQNE